MKSALSVWPYVFTSFHPKFTPGYHETLPPPAYHETLPPPANHETLLPPAYHETLPPPAYLFWVIL